MADRQLSSRREADPRDPLRSAARLLPAAAQARRRTVRRISARVRRGLGLRRPHRQPLRSRDAVPLRARLSGGPAADDRRALGGRDHAADRPRREPQAAGGADRATAAPHGRRRTTSPTGCWASAGAPPNRCRPCLPRLSDARRCRMPSRCNSSIGCATRIRSIAPALTWLDERLAAQGTTADAVVRDEHQRQGAGERHGAQHHHQHAPDLRRRLDGAVRAHQPGRRRARGRQRAFAEMDFPTRNLYRSAIEELARGFEAHRTRDRAQRRPGAETGRRRTPACEQRPPARSRVIISSPADAARSKRRSASGRRCAPGSGAWTARSASAAMSAPAPSSQRSCSRCPLLSPLATRARLADGWCCCSASSARSRRSTRPSRWSTAA